mmetsp:Transcript_12790/g.37165  ORF Transcript_12790/g.37165 Transcript_12790/m.37165 type:complete len:153 (+) Transcript_12790:383-841(+)
MTAAARNIRMYGTFSNHGGGVRDEITALLAEMAALFAMIMIKRKEERKEWRGRDKAALPASSNMIVMPTLLFEHEILCRGDWLLDRRPPSLWQRRSDDRTTEQQNDTFETIRGNDHSNRASIIGDLQQHAMLIGRNQVLSSKKLFHPPSFEK